MRLDERFVDRQIDVVALADDGPVPDRDQCDVRAHGRGDLERRLSRRKERRTTGQAAHRELARERVDDRVRSDERRVRAGRAERRRRDDHELRVLGADCGHVDTGVPGVEPDVRVGEQCAEVLRVVAHDRSLVDVTGRGERIERHSARVSTRTTSAPRSASNRALLHDGESVVSTTRSPTRGSGGIPRLVHSRNVIGLGTVCKEASRRLLGQSPARSAGWARRTEDEPPPPPPPFFPLCPSPLWAFAPHPSPPTLPCRSCGRRRS